jgi:formylglycine-generating enzyme
VTGATRERVLRGAVLAWVIATAVGLAVACSGSTLRQGGVEAVLTTDLDVPGEVDGLRLQVSQRVAADGGWTTLFDETFDVPAEATLPTTFSIAAGANEDQTAWIRATALRHGVAADLREVTVQVPRDRVVEVPVRLAKACYGKVEACPAGESCQPDTGGCGTSVGACFIDDAVYLSGNAKPTDGCQSCQPGVKTTEWSPTSGNACGDTAGGTCASGTCAMPPSCAPGGAGMTNCGAGGSGAESCCTSLEVPGGTYYRTYTNSGSGPTGTADLATVSGFRLDKYEVTVGRFRRFVSAWNGGSGWTPSAGSGKHTHLNGGRGLATSGAGDGYESGWDASDNGNVAPTDANLNCGSTYTTWTTSAASEENKPINCVNWYEAEAFCIWDGGFLPSEAEWEYAAAGGSEQREYPWGTAAPGTGSEFAIYACHYPVGTTACSGVANLAPVGFAQRGAGKWGQIDLAGSLWEWNRDPLTSYANPCTNCAQAPAASQRAIRGGGLWSPADTLPPAARGGRDPAKREGSSGLRCARTP